MDMRPLDHCDRRILDSRDAQNVPAGRQRTEDRGEIEELARLSSGTPPEFSSTSIAFISGHARALTS